MSKLAAWPERLKEEVSRRQEEAKWLEQERREREEREKATRDEAERQAKLAEKLEADRQAKEKAERQAKLAVEKTQAERLEQERQEREAREKAAQCEAERRAGLAAQQAEAERKARERAATEAERKAREKAARDKIVVVWGRLRRLSPLVWAVPLSLLLLVGAFIVWPRGNRGQVSPTPTAATSVVAIRPSLPVSETVIQTAVPTLMQTPQPLSTLTATTTPSLTATPTWMPTSTPTLTPVTRTVTRTPKTPTPTRTPTLTQLERVAPRDGGGPYRNPITFQWQGALGAGQAYQVLVAASSGFEEWSIRARSELLTTQSWTTYVSSGFYSGGRAYWRVAVISGRNVVDVSPTWVFLFNPLGGQPQPSP